MAFGVLLAMVAAAAIVHVVSGATGGLLETDAAAYAVGTVAVLAGVRWLLFRGPVWVDPFARTIRVQRPLGLGTAGEWGFDEVSAARLSSGPVRRMLRDTVKVRIGWRRLSFETPVGTGTLLIHELLSGDAAGARAASAHRERSPDAAGRVVFQLQRWTVPTFAIVISVWLVVGWLVESATFDLVHLAVAGATVLLATVAALYVSTSPEGTLTVDLAGQTLAWRPLTYVGWRRPDGSPRVYEFGDVRFVSRTTRRGRELLVVRTKTMRFRLRTRPEVADAIVSAMTPERSAQDSSLSARNG